MTYIILHLFSAMLSKDRGHFMIEVEKWPLRALRKEINPVAKNLRLTTAFKGPSSLHGAQGLALQPGSAAE